MFQIKNLSTGYSQKTNIFSNKKNTKILHQNLNFEIKKGEFLGILGMNGSGKSTLLRTIGGILPALEGNIFLNNLSISKYSLLELAQKRTLIWSQMPYISHFSVWDWLTTAQYPHTGWQIDISRKDEKFIIEILEKLDILTWKNRLLHTLSDGEKQRVMIAYSLASANEYLLFDEPTAHLDFVQKSHIFSQFKHLAHTQNKGIVVISHEISYIFGCADMILWLSENNYYWYDTPKNLLQKPDFMDYLKEKDENMLNTLIINYEL